MIEINDLYKKYNYPVPRYTSYPPANHFQEPFDNEKFINALKNSNNQQPENISIYIHIPFCKKMCHYCGCFKTPVHNEDIVEKYISALKIELTMLAKYLDKSRKLSQIHYGGGTPNAIPLHYLKEINELIFSQFEKIDVAEIAIECNPAYIELDDIAVLNDAGFNRISFGIQDFNIDVLNIVNRDASKIPADELVQHIREFYPHIRINFDFIYGLPGQTADSFLDTIQKAIEIKPDRLVTFSYAHVPWVNKAQLLLEKAGLPTEFNKIDMYFKSRDLLEKSGYTTIGFDHYVLENDELYNAFKTGNLHRNFQGYCTRSTTGQVYAVGVSSISQLETVYAQNYKSINAYIEKIQNGEFPVEKGYTVKSEEIIVRNVITNLLSNNSVDLQMIANKYNLSFSELETLLKIDYETLLDLENDGVMSLKNNRIEITKYGVLFIRNVAGALDPAYSKQYTNYSKPV
jgi:oxygen-independent coproporphyrinogen-3 oxidase